MKKIFTALALTLASACVGQAQLIITGTTYSQNFNSLGTTAAATLPSGWKIEATAAGTDTAYASLETATTAAYGTSGAGVVTSSSGGAAVNWANGITGSSTDRALGILNSGSFTTGKSIEFGVTNNTGFEISSFTLGWDYEKYRSGTRAWTWNFYTSTDGVAWTAVTDGNQAYAADANNTTVSNPPTTISKGFDINGLSIADGASYYFRWTLVGTGGSSNGQGLAIDNFTFAATTVVPEPTTSAMILGGIGMMVWVLRRKRAVQA